MDATLVGKQSRRIKHRGSCERQYDWARSKKNALKPHLAQQWVIPPQASGAFVAAMEDVLAVYKRPRDEDCPLVCFDEASKQLLADTRSPIPMKPGQPERRDYEYERNGTANLFMMFAPLEGWRHVEITDRRTAIDYAHALEDLSDRHFPNANKIVLVQDNLSTHKPASFYEAFPPDKARRLVERFEWRYTPKHGSWLIWPNPNSAFLPHNASTGVLPTDKSSRSKSLHGRLTGTNITPKPIGSSRPMTPALNSNTYTRLSK